MVPIAGVLLALAAAAVTIDAAFLIVALIAVFILVPTMLMFVYYLYALKPRTVMLGAGDTEVVIHDNELGVKVSRPERPDYTFGIPIADIREITPGSPYDAIVYGEQPDQFILIDNRAFTDSCARIQFHNYIFDRISKK